MTDAISHRGPDDTGLFIAGDETSLPDSERGDVEAVRVPQVGRCGVGLGHRRLSIIAPGPRGRQPLTHGDEQAWISYNGEIYNFQELRAELEALGVSFETRTDSEVVLAAYRTWGPEFVRRCSGMFAFAILDLGDRSLHLFRDRVGIKPLYFWSDDGALIFASELKAVLEEGSPRRAIDRTALHAYLGLQVVDHRPESFVSGVRQLPPGHRAQVDLGTGEVVVTPWYDLAEAVEARRTTLPSSLDDLVELVRATFTDSVRSHMVSDVPIGSCLSGGLDSSSIVCVAEQLREGADPLARELGERITTFSSCHSDPSVDEQEFMDEVIDHVGARAIKVFSTPDGLQDRFEQLVWHQDEPFTSPAIYAQYCLMEAARAEGIKVLLDGQGGDEIFAGYRKFFFFNVRNLLRSGSLGSAAREVAGGLLHGDGDLFDPRAMKRYAPAWLKPKRSVSDFLTFEADDSSMAGFARGADVASRQVLDIERFSVPALLRYEDRNSMAFGVEARVPFLDHSMIELGIALPVESKIHHGVAKYAMRQAMRGTVPTRILDRRTKMGFAVPDARWVTEGLRPVVEEVLAEPHPVTADLVRMPELAREYRRLVSGRTSALKPREIFRVVCLDRWCRVFRVTDVNAG